MKKVLYILVCLGMASAVSAQVTYQLPENNARFIAVERASSENDLVFTVDDSAITEVDVLFGPENDPNLTAKSEYLIKNITSVTPGEYEVTLVTELSEDLENSTDYYWKVITYEPNETGYFVHVGPVWSFTTIQIGPYLDPVTPSANGVFAGEDAEFSVISSNVDTLQWYKEGMGALANGADYDGVNTETLTIFDAQPEDEGSYYCVGTKSGYPDVTSSPYGELYIKQLKHHFEFNSADVVGDISPDSISGVQAQLIGGATVVAGPNTIVGEYLLLENPGTDAEDTEYVQILDPNVFDYPEITVSVWYNMDTIDNKFAVWDSGFDAENYWVFSPSHDSAARSEFYLEDARRQVVSGYSRNEDQWYFATVTIKDGVAKLYIDGKFEDDYENEEDPMYNPLDLTKTAAFIGYRVDGAISGIQRPKFNGYIDELKVYNYAMSTEDVAQEYMDIRTEVEYICNDEIYDLGAYDYDDDCQIGLGDLAEIVSRWLENYRIQ